MPAEGAQSRALLQPHRRMGHAMRWYAESGRRVKDKPIVAAFRAHR